MNTGALQDTELLARFITSSRWFRNGDQTVRPDAFIPHPYPDLSVTRHRESSDAEIWATGEAVIANREQRPKLHGRADLTVRDVRDVKLQVEAQPVPENINHAAIVGWPADKPAQKIYAVELAAKARRFIPNPKVHSDPQGAPR